MQMSKKKSEDHLRERFMQFQMLQKQMEQINEHIELIQRQREEVIDSIDALEGLEQVKENTEVFAPIATGVFIKTSLKDTKNLLINVGADTVVERSVMDVIGLLKKQEDGLQEKMKQAGQILEQLQEQAMQIYRHVETAEE